MKCKIMKGDDMSLESYFRKIERLDKIEISAGVLENKKHPETDFPLPAIAYINQFGSIRNNIPERPFMTDGAVIASEDISHLWGEVFRDYFLHNKGLAAFKLIGKVSREAIAKAIAMQRFTPLSPATLSWRQARGNGSSAILIDRGYLINSLSDKVSNKRNDLQ